MAKKYIKSHSNYVLQTKHQNTTGGTIFERDITTIGGRNQFSKGQVPIYQSGNFVITVNAEDSSYKKINEGEWYKNEYGEIWTKQVTDTFDPSHETSDSSNITIKKDFHNLRDYAYYGSCSELIRASINDILKRYPGELFIPETSSYIVDGVEYFSEKTADEALKYAQNKQKIEKKGVRVGYHDYSDTENEVNPLEPSTEWKPFVLPDYVKPKVRNNLALVDNPFGIDIHSKKIPEIDYDPLRYWADGGSEKYSVYLKDEDGEWNFDEPYDLIYEVVYDGKGRCESISEEKINLVLDGNGVDLSKTVDLCEYAAGLYVDITSEATREVSENDDCERGETICPGDYMGRIILYFSKNKEDFDGTPSPLRFNGDGTPSNGGAFTITEESSYKTIGPYEIYFFMGDNGQIFYLVEAEDENFDYRIRPKNSEIEKFYDTLDLFQNIILNRKTEPVFTSYFEVINENDYGQYTHTEHFTFPTSYGDYNLGSTGVAFENYLSRLSHIGSFYDDMFSDNLWRSMTHESIKNFDWTFTRRFTDGEDAPFIEGGQRIQKIIRLFGRGFDELKNYIDPIKSSNKVTYEGSDNIPDYFLSDKLEECGWDVKLIYPLVLKEYAGDNSTIPYNFHDNDLFTVLETENKVIIPGGNEVSLKRVFTQDYESKYCTPYFIQEGGEVIITDGFSLSKTQLRLDTDCRESDTVEVVFNPCSEDVRTYYYSNDRVYSYFDVNTEFFRRLILNSKYIMRHKGTIESLEMVFALFNMKKGRDYDVFEYTAYAQPIKDEWDNVLNNFKMDWINSTKLTTYNTEEFKQGRYVPYQGLPVSYRELVKDDGTVERKLYPYFNSNFEYDGDTYYQMNGGWLMKKPFMFDKQNNIIPEGYGQNERTNRLFTETIKNVKCVQTLQELLDNPSLASNNGDIVQVIDLSGVYAVIDGILYPLFKDEVSDDVSNSNTEEYYYFYASISSNFLSIGNAIFTDHVIISNPYYTNQRQRIDLSDEYYNNREIKIYVIKKYDITNNSYNYNLNVSSNESTISTFTVFENGKYMEGDNYTNFFRINDVNFYNELSVLGWQQLRDNDYDYYALNAITDDSEGNNPHTGHMNYDNGHEYMLRFKKLFKHVLENDLFDHRRYDEYSYNILNNANAFGFEGLVEDDECNKDYDRFLNVDSKCHYFGDYIKKNDNDSYVEFQYDIDMKPSVTKYSNVRVQPYNLSTVDGLNNGVSFDCTNGECGTVKFTLSQDGVTDQVVNTKRFKLVIYIDDEEEYSVSYLEKVKYYDSVVMSYVTQMLPSTLICTVEYNLKKITRDK